MTLIRNVTTLAEKLRERDYDRRMLRAAFQSLFLSAIHTRKKSPGGYMLRDLATATNNFKSTVSRWFSPNNPPNWQIDTMADIADALGLDLRIEAHDRKTSDVYTPQGLRPAENYTIIRIARVNRAAPDAPRTNAFTDDVKIDSVKSVVAA